MTIYLRNATPQVRMVGYRLQYTPPGQSPTAAERRGFKMVRLEPWGRGVIPVDGPECAPIIADLESHGFLAQVDVPRALVGLVAGVYNLDTPVTDHAADAAVRHNRGHKTAEGHQRRTEAAIASGDQLERALREAGVPQASLPGLHEVEFEQDADTTGAGQRVEEGYKVQSNTPSATEPPGRRTTRRRAA
jgi:hypothetical protein